MHQQGVDSHLVLLKVVGHDCVGSQADMPRDGLLLPHDQPQQGALATPVRACTASRMRQKRGVEAGEQALMKSRQDREAWQGKLWAAPAPWPNLQAWTMLALNLHRPQHAQQEDPAVLVMGNQSEIILCSASVARRLGSRARSGQNCCMTSAAGPLAAPLGTCAGSQSSRW